MRHHDMQEDLEETNRLVEERMETAIDRMMSQLAEERERFERMQQELQQFLEEYWEKLGPTFEQLERLNQGASRAGAAATEDHHAISSQARMKRLYLDLVKTHHPDSSDEPALPEGGNHRLFADITQAYRSGNVAWLEQIHYRTMVGRIRKPALRAAMMNAYYRELHGMHESLTQKRLALQSSPEYLLMQKHFLARICGVNLVQDVLDKAQRKLRYAYIKTLIDSSMKGLEAR